jgi:hypothetical protein
MGDNIKMHKITISNILGNEVAFNFRNSNTIELVDSKAGLYVIYYQNKGLTYMQKILVTYDE